jgi:hypothetical protein
MELAFVVANKIAISKLKGSISTTASMTVYPIYSIIKRQVEVPHGASTFVPKGYKFSH